MSLVNASWSTAGKYRAGGAISFGSGQSYGEAKHTVIWDNWGPDITLGLTIHPSEDASNGVIVSRTGSFQLAIAAGKLVWSVTTAGGQTVNVTSTRSLVAGEYYTLKLTYKSTTGQAKILFENKLDASALHPMAAVSVQPYELGLAPSTSTSSVQSICNICRYNLHANIYVRVAYFAEQAALSSEVIWRQEKRHCSTRGQGRWRRSI